MHEGDMEHNFEFLVMYLTEDERICKCLGI